MGNRKPFKIRTLIAITALVGLFSGATAGAFLALTRDLPQIRELENFEPSAVTRVYSADGVLLSELFLEKRIPVPIDQMPAALKKALIVTEDRQFYSHSGIDLRGILRAIVKDIMAGQFVEGASTITQQLAKTLFLTPEKTLGRKIKEALLAIQLERRYTKGELLALYLNQIYLGSGAYGVESAARLFFGIPASRMNLAQCALIAGLPQAPSRFSPLVNPDLARKRRNLVLTIMRSQGIVNETQYRQAISEPVTVGSPQRVQGSAPYFLQYIKPALEAAVGPDLLYKGGLTVHTTLSHRFQQAAEQAVKTGIDDLYKRTSQGKENSVPPQGALVALDVRTGGILAMVGGRDFSESPFNRAVDARRQPGSAFKPIVYALAIARGFTQASLVLDAPVVFKGGPDNADWRPENYSGHYLGEMTLRRALALSKNIPAVRLAERLGPSDLVQFAHKMGIQTPLSPNLSLALGTAGTHLLELTGAMSVFPQGGNHIAPFGVAEILDRDGDALWRARPAVRPVLTTVQAAIMVDMLQGVVQEGTGKRARRLNMPVGGKTGTTNDFKDALFLGFSPEAACGVWVGMDDASPLGDRETGARAALPIWIDFMAATRPESTPLYFDIPDGTTKIFMDPVTGRRVNETEKNAVRALFAKGTEPSKK
ncbi:penicillin-binding protein [Desulfosarcina widdelii]|uniref:peptidoglycan glycosyltransferase n=1 Tax=Desulfosarcina widdelii TaxID=947919 RepID=A0A5K7ZE78_9BACT|nr:penicillin-binding protein 1A [Desulfosarcina widdelii]BBO74517.1 penicillin-binding protein [Desulfosarcina widdelii]